MSIFLRKAKQLLARIIVLHIVKKYIFFEYLSRINFALFIFFAVISLIISQ